jgi:hypothetical protein
MDFAVERRCLSRDYLRVEVWVCVVEILPNKSAENVLAVLHNFV